jgi:hypothetical protein
MDKKSAAKKVAKLRRLAEDPRSPAGERENARRAADRITSENHLSPADLDVGKMCSAYDELVGEIEKFVKNNPNLPSGLFGAEKVVTDVVGKLRLADDSDKSARLRTFVTVVRTASIFVGDNRYVSEIKSIMDAALGNNNVRI